MFFCAVCSCYNDFRRGISVNGIVHLILYCRKEIFRDLAIKGIIDGSSEKALVQCLQSLIGFSLSVSIKLNIICRVSSFKERTAPDIIFAVSHPIRTGAPTGWKGKMAVQDRERISLCQRWRGAGGVPSLSSNRRRVMKGCPSTTSYTVYLLPPRCFFIGRHL